MRPMIAVILPIYNQEKCLERALGSLAAQTFRDFVVFGVDDGSTDKTADILSACRKRGAIDLRIVTKPNGGVSSARNAGLKAALAAHEVTHVAFLDPDDAYHPQCLEVAAHFLSRDPAALYEWGIRSCARPEDLTGLSRYCPEGLEAKPFHGSPSVCNKVFPVEAVRNVRFYEETAIAEDLAFVTEVRHRSQPRCVGIPAELLCYVAEATSVMHRPLRLRDFVQRRKVVRYLVDVFADDAVARTAFCRTKLFNLLKRFYRDGRRVVPGERRSARDVLCACLHDLRATGNLRLRSPAPNDLKYYLLFLVLSWRGGKCQESQS